MQNTIVRYIAIGGILQVIRSHYRLFGDNGENIILFFIGIGRHPVTVSYI